ncbi:MAG: hypothetical protein FD174_762 [Geobacteraceae bacterium]|nr:MAG: hypothetical protein FD174_762 [Geobacteraceae bacterium]
MLVRVLLSDGGDAMIDSFHLDELIGSGQVLKLKRSSGWAVVGVDKLRGMAKGAYNGYERRRDILQMGGQSLFWGNARAWR